MGVAVGAGNAVGAGVGVGSCREMSAMFSSRRDRGADRQRGREATKSRQIETAFNIITSAPRHGHAFDRSLRTAGFDDAHVVQLHLIEFDEPAQAGRAPGGSPGELLLRARDRTREMEDVVPLLAQQDFHLVRPHPHLRPRRRMVPDLADYLVHVEPQITKHDGLVHVSWGSPNVFGDREHVHALMLLLKKVLAGEPAQGES
jgi:hypothetical protein